MADHPTISTESDLASPTLPTAAVTRRLLLGGAGIAVGTAMLASPPSMPGIAPAAAQPVSADPRPLDAAFKRRAVEVREVCASINEKIPIAPHPTNGDVDLALELGDPKLLMDDQRAVFRRLRAGNRKLGCNLQGLDALDRQGFLQGCDIISVAISIHATQ